MKNFGKIKKAVCIGILGAMLSVGPAVVANTEVSDIISLPVLKQGMSSEDVGRLQKELTRYGYYQGAIDGNFGYDTIEAVLHFQQDCGLAVDGIVGEQTWIAIRNYPTSGISRSQIDNRKGQQIALFAQKYLGTRYAWGGSGPGGFDCSGFISYVFRQHGITLPRMADEQFNVGLKVSNSNLSLGDVVFFTTYEPGPSHAGIYIGNGNFIHASSAAGQVVITPMSKDYYRERFLGGRRLVY